MHLRRQPFCICDICDVRVIGISDIGDFSITASATALCATLALAFDINVGQQRTSDDIDSHLAASTAPVQQEQLLSLSDSAAGLHPSAAAAFSISSRASVLKRSLGAAVTATAATIHRQHLRHRFSAAAAASHQAPTSTTALSAYAATTVIQRRRWYSSSHDGAVTTAANSATASSSSTSAAPAFWRPRSSQHFS